MASGYFKLHDGVTVLFILMLMWPGYRDLEPLEAPKKGYWTAGSIFWPLRRAYRSLWPVDLALARPMQDALRLALTLAVVADLGARLWPAAADVMNRGGAEVVFAAVWLLIGRAAGFWSADRRIAKRAALKESAAAAQAHRPDLP